MTTLLNRLLIPLPILSIASRSHFGLFIVARFLLASIFSAPITQVGAKLFTCSALDRHSALNTCTLGHVESSSDSATLSDSDSYRGSFFCFSLNRAHPITRTHDGGGGSQ